MDASNNIHVSCTKCGKKLQVPSALAGKAGTCKCGARVNIPLSLDSDTECERLELSTADSVPPAPLPVAAGHWYYQLMGEAIGPIPWEKLAQLARDGVLTQDCFIRSGPEGDWFSVDSIDGLFSSNAPGQDNSSAASIRPSAANVEPAGESGRNFLRTPGAMVVGFLLVGLLIAGGVWLSRVSKRNDSVDHASGWPAVTASEHWELRLVTAEYAEVAWDVFDQGERVTMAFLRGNQPIPNTGGAGPAQPPPTWVAVVLQAVRLTDGNEFREFTGGQPGRPSDVPPASAVRPLFESVRFNQRAIETYALFAVTNRNEARSKAVRVNELYKWPAVTLSVPQNDSTFVMYCCRVPDTIDVNKPFQVRFSGLLGCPAFTQTFTPEAATPQPLAKPGE